MARKHGAGGRDHRHTDVVEELKNAFELAERSSPGITNRYQTTKCMRNMIKEFELSD